VGVVLPGGGTVRLRDLELHQYAHNESQEAATDADWWGTRTSVVIGGLGGAAFGVLASRFAWLADRGRARSTVLAGVTTMIVVAAACLATGLVAVALRQPYSVYYPLLLLGVLGVLIMPARLRAMRQRYTDLELQRIRRHDLSAG
jgi:ABC-type Fe3+ transport system permease subunit